MSVFDTTKEIVRIGITAGLSKDVIDLLEKKLALLTDELALVHRKNAEFQAENAQLRQQLQRLQPVSHGLTDEQMHVLRHMDEARDYVYADGVAQALGIAGSRADYLLGQLSQSEYIYETPNIPPRYMIEQKGRDAVHNPMA